MNPVERLVRRVDRWQQRHAASAFTFGVIKKYGDDNGGQLPVVSRELTRNVHQLHRASVVGLVVGLLFALWGSAGLAQSGMFAMAQVWNLPGPDRPGYFQRLGRAGLFLLVLGAGVILTTVLTGFGTFGSSSLVVAVVAELLAAAANVGMYTTGFRVLTPKAIPIRQLVPGAVLAGIGWTILEAAGTQLVHHYLHRDSVYGIFAIVLSLVAWIYLVV